MLAGYTYQLRSQGYGARPLDLHALRALIRGDREATFEAFAERFMSASNISSAAARESIRNVLVENELGVILARRVKAMPKVWEFKAASDDAAQKKLAEDLMAWASGPITDQGLSLFAITGAIDEDQETDGNAVLVMSGRKGALRLALRDTCHLGLSVDPLTQALTAAEFCWRYELPAGGSNKAEVYTYEQRITPEGMTLSVNGKQHQEKTEPGFGFLPVVVIPRSMERGRPIGRSGACDLIEAYLAVIWSAYLMNVANKYEANGLYCLPVGADAAAFYDETGKKVTKFEVSPGCFYPMHLAKIGGGINIASIAEQYNRAEATLYRLGMCKKDRGESSDMRSGKAMVIDTQELGQYIDEKMALRRAGLERLANMWAWAEGRVPIGEPAGIVIECEAAGAEDPQEQSKRGELWLKARSARECTSYQMLRAWQRLGLIDEDADIDTMVEDIDSAEDTAVARMLSAQRAMLPGSVSSNAAALFAASPEEVATAETTDELPPSTEVVAPKAGE